MYLYEDKKSVQGAIFHLTFEDLFGPGKSCNSLQYKELQDAKNLRPAPGQTSALLLLPMVSTAAKNSCRHPAITTGRQQTHTNGF